MLNRAEHWAMRGSILGSGASCPIFVVQRQTQDEDTSRGVRGTAVAQEEELNPRPVISDIKGDLQTRSGIQLKAGDLVITIPANQITELALKSPSTQIRLGNPPKGDLLKIMTYECDDYDNVPMRYRIFARGITNR